ncbi:cytochrome C oxidase subunit IV family protein [Nocardia uniformis]|uniref:Cytochrome C oxidase subunit IV family protein n=1 Tax=Nocardia uniformis TaxID=53432 RepID=A0A849C375_9NOCA|nr:cytochrome C oxidase subunit IV family protein [Nocardia uniformis]NNH70890.1 cytochrome C oxidase subunit IV family protein [Nocardia uniformis]
MLQLALRTPVFRVWLFLMACTLISWGVGSVTIGGVGDSGSARDAYTTIVLAIAIIKIWFVIRYFMDAREAPRKLRIICDVWVVLVGLSIISLYPFGLL